MSQGLGIGEDDFDGSLELGLGALVLVDSEGFVMVEGDEEDGEDVVWDVSWLGKWILYIESQKAWNGDEFLRIHRKKM